VHVDAVAVLIGSRPDTSFLPAEVLEVLQAAGEPSDVSADGVRATHPVYFDVEPFAMEVRAVAGLHALGPLRGDNFVRFAVHDGQGVAAAIRGHRKGTVPAAVGLAVPEHSGAQQAGARAAEAERQDEADEGTGGSTSTGCPAQDTV